MLGGGTNLPPTQDEGWGNQMWWALLMCGEKPWIFHPSVLTIANWRKLKYFPKHLLLFTKLKVIWLMFTWECNFSYTTTSDIFWHKRFNVFCAHENFWRI
jgi:hypothetical protein